jgi:hypothetical protein
MFRHYPIRRCPALHCITFTDVPTLYYSQMFSHYRFSNTITFTDVPILFHPQIFMFPHYTRRGCSCTSQEQMFPTVTHSQAIPSYQIKRCSYTVSVTDIQHYPIHRCPHTIPCTGVPHYHIQRCSYAVPVTVVCSRTIPLTNVPTLSH